jgi:hypothetical protein
MKQVAIAEPIAVSEETGISPCAFELIKHCSTGKFVKDLDDEYYASMFVKTTAGAPPPEEQRIQRREEHQGSKCAEYRLLDRYQWQNAPPPPPVPEEPAGD